MATIVNENATKICQVSFPIRVNHKLKDLQKQRELAEGTIPSIASLVVELVEKALEMEAEKQPA
jgi:hypothetical protein